MQSTRHPLGRGVGVQKAKESVLSRGNRIQGRHGVPLRRWKEAAGRNAAHRSVGRGGRSSAHAGGGATVTGVFIPKAAGPWEERCGAAGQGAHWIEGPGGHPVSLAERSRGTAPGWVTVGPRLASRGAGDLPSDWVGVFCWVHILPYSEDGRAGSHF